MSTQYTCSIPRPSGDQLNLVLETGRSIVIIGANGSGKTRLGVHIENGITARAVHRIAAQKSLTMSDTINLMSLERATSWLRFGNPDGHEGHKPGNRWNNNPATNLLTDYEALLQTLFAEYNRVASKHLQDRKANSNISVPTTKLDQLKEIWDGLLPHRALEILESSIKVLPKQQGNMGSYRGSEMSDGERAIFYALGQCLVAPENGAIIIDEPEVHIHKAILGPLWDAAEKARPDCGFIYITHDLDFAVTHSASTKYNIRAYNNEPREWDIEELPEDTGLPEDVVVELVGSRKPILFVEGERSSIDLTIYRSQYSDFTIMPVGGCEAVIHSVASYLRSASLHRLGVRGLVDADDRDGTTVANLQSQGIYVLPVAEVENLLLLPDVFLALAHALSCADPPALLLRLKDVVMREASANPDQVSARYTTRKLDRHLKYVQVKSKDLQTLLTTYEAELATIDPTAIFKDFKVKLSQKIQENDLAGVLRLYDNKGLLAQAAIILGISNQKQLLEKVGRLLGGDAGKKVREELTKALPSIPIPS